MRGREAFSGVKTGWGWGRALQVSGVLERWQVAVRKRWRGRGGRELVWHLWRGWLVIWWPSLWIELEAGAAKRLCEAVRRRGAGGGELTVRRRAAGTAPRRQKDGVVGGEGCIGKVPGQLTSAGSLAFVLMPTLYA